MSIEIKEFVGHVPNQTSKVISKTKPASKSAKAVESKAKKTK